MTLIFLVKDQTISMVSTKVQPRQGSSGYLKLKFLYVSSIWQELRKTLYISSGDYAEPYILDSDEFLVPAYYTQQSSFNITFLGDSDSVVLPTNVVTLTLEPSNELWEATPPDPQDSAYLALFTQIANHEARIKQLEDSGGGIKTVNGIAPDESGNVEVDALPDNAEQIEMLIEADMLPAVYDASGAILTDENGNVILRY